MTATTPRTRPILFKGAMVRAILAGAKTVTRRPVKKLPHDNDAGNASLRECAYGAGWCFHDEHGNCTCKGVHAPFTEGMRLWVRETWHSDERDLGAARAMHEDLMSASPIFYRADHLTGTTRDAGWRWRSAIHMPRWASRLTLEITSVRAERLQAITEEDARAEGVEPEEEWCSDKPAREVFFSRWDALYAKRPELLSQADPWIWRVEFRRVEEKA